jgi:hypothetical protein
MTKLEKICAQCEVHFQVPAMNRRQKFCSVLCSSEARKVEWVPMACAHCGAQFALRPGTARNRQYCSHGCAMRANAYNRRLAERDRTADRGAIKTPQASLLTVLAIAEGCGVAKATAELLAALLLNGNRPMSSLEIGEAVNSHRPLSVGAVHERIRTVRLALGNDVIASTQPEGGHPGDYSLTPRGLQACAEALNATADKLRAEADLATAILQPKGRTG